MGLCSRIRAVFGNARDYVGTAEESEAVPAVS